MSDFISLTCPSCSGQLRITADIERFACVYCGTEHIVKRGGGMVSLAPVVQGLAKVQAGVDRTAAELAIQRLTGDVAELKRQRDLATVKAKPILNRAVGSGLGQVIGVIFGLGGLSLACVFGLLIVLELSTGSDPSLFVGIGLLLGGLPVLAGLLIVWNSRRSRRAADRAKLGLSQLDERVRQTQTELQRQRDLLAR